MGQNRHVFTFCKRATTGKIYYSLLKGDSMDIASIPIVDFLKFCRKGARNKGYYWIACILSRTSDSKKLYENIKEDWQSLDSITGNKFLVLLAGNEIDSTDRSYRDCHDLNSCITDNHESYIKRFNPFATIIGNSNSIKADLSSVRYSLLHEYIDKIELTQTDAIQSLKQYFGIEEQSIPCLVYIPLYEDQYPFNNIIVPLPKYDADLYMYFKELFVDISPMIAQLSQNCDELTLRIDKVYDKLISLVNKRSDSKILLKCINKKIYYKCDEPVRGLLNQYIDLCKNYERINKNPYVHSSERKSDLLVRIETALEEHYVPKIENKAINAYINIGENNRFKNSPISITIQNEI